jgi:galactokinase
MPDLEPLVNFQQIYPESPRVFSAPGRVNLIGEHTDYNEGFVLPIAVDRRAFVAGALNNDSVVRVHSLNLDEQVEIDLSKDQSDSLPHWASYVEGVARVLKERGFGIEGANLSILSHVPMGAGMSSSAALEISVGFALLSLAEIEVDPIQLALAAQRAEHQYAGTRCGLMDQLAAVFGQKHHALLIDCRTFERTPIELNLKGFEVVVCDTNVKHQLAGSAYNERRAQCEQGVELLKQVVPDITSLRDVTIDQFEKHAHLLPEPIRSRCRHVVTENDRTLKAAENLRAGDTAEFGRLMLASHRSLRDDYEVSCRELDIMVELATRQDGVAGARMTGGGFGGCTVNLVRESAIDSFSAAVMQGYRERTGIEGTVYVVEADEGVREEPI